MDEHDENDRSADSAGSTTLPLLKPPFTKEAMLAEFYNAVYHWTRALGFATGNAPALRLLAPEGAPRDYDWDAELPEEPATPRVIDELRTWPVTEIIERLYEYGMLGITYEPIRSMGDESIYTYACAFLEDLMKSRVHEELEAATGCDFFPRMALEAAQTALARHILEDQRECFYVFAGQGQEGELTIRDVALLARMEEKSVRNAANPKRPGHLKTQSRDGSTYVAPADAREWLKARGRYIPLTRGYRQANLNLESTSFPSLEDARRFIIERFRSLGMTAGDLGRLAKLDELRDPPPEVLSKLDPDFRAQMTFDFALSQARNASLMERFARALELPSALFVMRMKEAALNEELYDLRGAIRNLSSGGG